MLMLLTGCSSGPKVPPRSVTSLPSETSAPESSQKPAAAAQPRLSPPPSVSAREATPAAQPSVSFQLGSEVLEKNSFRELRGKKVGLITNPSAVNRRGQSTIELLRKAPGVRVVALFGPEHGITGTAKAGVKVEGSKDPKTGLPVHSLYGQTRKPTAAMLQGIDCLVYDIQDIGCRSYTFISTMGLAMEACAENGIEFVVLDRPNPLGGLHVEGPLLDNRYQSFVGFYPIPYVYGLTCGELARMAQGEGWIKRARLTVIPMTGWRRSMTWRDTSLRWIPPSPRIPRSESGAYYASTGILGEIGGINIGMAYEKPFEIISAPWMKGTSLAREMERHRLPGVLFRPFSTTFGAVPQQGVEIEFTDLPRAPLTAINFLALDAIRQSTGRDLFGEARRRKKDWEMLDKITGGTEVRSQLERGASGAQIVASWKSGEEQFRQRRQKYLLY